MKQRKYTATYWARVQGGWQVADSYSANNWVACVLWARKQLHGVVTETTNGCYWRDVGRAPHVDIESVERKYHEEDGREYPVFRDRVEPKVVIVPSVGELGYW